MATSLKQSLAAETWRIMLDYLISTSPARERSLAARRLTPNDAKALHILDAKTGRPMGDLARMWNCDPSMVTWIIDRMERRGLVERRASTTDRRIKIVLLTSKGEKMRKELMDEFRAPTPEMERLTKSELESLQTIVRKLVGHRAARATKPSRAIPAEQPDGK